jgi:hypothetical protein
VPPAAWPEAGLSSVWSVDERNCTPVSPVFMVSDYNPGGNGDLTADAGVLHPSTPAAVCFGAEDGAEMGAYRQGRRQRPVRVASAQHFDPATLHTYELADLIFAQAITLGAPSNHTLYLRRVALSEVRTGGNAVTQVSAPAGGASPPLMQARDSVLGDVVVDTGQVRLEYSTVLGNATCAVLQASDCIFHGELTLQVPAPTDAWPHCVRYSRVPAAVLPVPSPATIARFPHCTAAPAVFMHARIEQGILGQAGCGVLHPAAPSAIGQGAEDGGEMGAYHALRHVLSRAALRDKLIEHLPLGMEPVLIPDPRLLAPPALLPTLVKNTQESPR